jgi:hypothetical protein
VLESRYHDSPMKIEGGLVWDFGLDLPEALRLVGFRTTVHDECRNTLTFVSTARTLTSPATCDFASSKRSSTMPCAE